MAERLEAAVFDVDGMLLDTREFIFQAFEHSLRTHGHDVPSRQEIAKQIGRSLEACYTALAPNGELAVLCDTHGRFQADALTLIAPYEGLHDMLQGLKDAGLKLAAFSSRRENLWPSLDNAGITPFLEAIVDGDDVEHHKPHPEGLLLALNNLSVQPNRAAMIGDAAVDIQAGKTAQVALTIGITHGFGVREELEAAGPDYIVDSLREIPPLLVR